MSDRAQSGGTPVDLMIHDFDQANWLLGEPRSVYASEPTPGHVHAVVEYDGACAAIEGSMAMPRSYPFSSSIRVLCDGGVAEYAFSAAPVEGEGNIGASSSARGLRLYPVDGVMTTVPVESADPWGPEIEEFVSCLEQGRRPEQGTGKQATAALRVSLAAARSLRDRRIRGGVIEGTLQRVLARLDERRDDAADLLAALVAVNSVNPAFAGVQRADVIGGETRVNELLRERYEQAGLETHWVAPDPERRNLVGVRRERAADAPSRSTGM